MLDSLTLQHVLVNGTLISILLSIIILTSLMYNARLWLQDYPKPMRDKVPPLSAAEKRQRAILAVIVMGVLFGGTLLATLQLRAAQAGSLTFGVAYLYSFLLLLVFNLFDALVLDLLIIAWLQPKFVVLPGTEGMEYLFRDYRKHVGDFLKGMVFCVVASVPFAVIAIL